MIAIITSKSKIVYPVLTSILLLMVSCNKYPTVSSDIDLLELERVWQFLSALSIYQERIPQEKDLLSYANPATLVQSIEDTLHSPWSTTKDYYGHYYERWEDLWLQLNGATSKARNNGTTVYYKSLTPNTLYLHLKSFGATTVNEILAMNDVVKNKTNIIFDLRNDGGGYIETCERIVDLLLPQNITYLQEEKREMLNGKYTTIIDSMRTELVDSLYKRAWEGKKIALLVNRYSASASEILIMALKTRLDTTRVRIFGERSYGKGIGQNIIYFYATSGGALKLTSYRFKGITTDSVFNNYHEKGIPPDVEIPNFQGALKIEDVKTAGTWLEPNFSTLVDQQALNEITTQSANNSIGYRAESFKIMPEDSVPLF